MSLQSIKSKSLASFNLDKENGFPKSNTKHKRKRFQLLPKLILSSFCRWNRGYRFSLKGNVSIVGEGVSIACSNTQIFSYLMQILVLRSKSEELEIQAEGAVTLKQTGRICQADKLNLIRFGGGSLEGSARVEDDAWGSAVGEKILLEKETGKVQILVKKFVTKVDLPPDLDKLKFPFAPKRRIPSRMTENLTGRELVADGLIKRYGKGKYSKVFR